MKKRVSDLAYQIDMENKRLKKRYCFNCEYKDNCTTTILECRKKKLKRKKVMED